VSAFRAVGSESFQSERAERALSWEDEPTPAAPHGPTYGLWLQGSHAETSL